MSEFVYYYYRTYEDGADSGLQAQRPNTTEAFEIFVILHDLLIRMQEVATG